MSHSRSRGCQSINHRKAWTNVTTALFLSAIYQTPTTCQCSRNIDFNNIFLLFTSIFLVLVAPQLCTHESSCLLQLWHTYLNERRIAVRGLSIKHAGVESLNNTYERSLVSMHKMPRIWIDYIEILMEQGFITRSRRTLDRALTSLPVTQHDRIWVLYLKFATHPEVPMDTAFRVYRRYLRYAPPSCWMLCT